MFIWIFLAVGAYVLVGLLFGRFLGGGTLRRIRDEIFEEALPSSPTGGDRTAEGAPPGFRWTETVNLTASDHLRSPAQKRGEEQRRRETERVGSP